MKSARRKFLGVAVGATLAISLPVLAQTAGKEYTPISPAQQTDEPAKIEVLEFFSYGCPHCSDFHQPLSAWVAKLPGDVVVKRVPVSFGRGAWANIAKLYYALEATGDLAKLDGEVFKAVHNDRINLFEEKNILEWVAKKGVDQKKFSETFNSFGVMSKVKRGDQLAQAYKISGVPSLAVDGKYMVAGKDFSEQLANADKLIAKARSEKPGKK
jgi:protein dithiol oxidoreductase (disulfide-forming)